LNGAEGFVSSEMPSRIAGGSLSISPFFSHTQITLGRYQNGNLINATTAPLEMLEERI
jgi:hypothetical protein